MVPESKMIRLSKLTDYAVVVLSRMAQDAGAVHTAPALSRSTGVPEPTVQKCLKLLARASLVASRRGAAGGYALSRPAEAISVAEIIIALDGPIALTACVDGASGGCGVERVCAMRGGWDQVNRAIKGALEGVTLADMAAPSCAHAHTPVAMPEFTPANARN
jgi:FeS assembly SUF system regulator